MKHRDKWNEEAKPATLTLKDQAGKSVVVDAEPVKMYVKVFEPSATAADGHRSYYAKCDCYRPHKDKGGAK